MLLVIFLDKKKDTRYPDEYLESESDSIGKQVRILADTDTYNQAGEKTLSESTLHMLNSIDSEYVKAVEAAKADSISLNSILSSLQKVLIYHLGNSWRELYDMEDYEDLPLSTSKEVLRRTSNTMETLGDIALQNNMAFYAAESLFAAACSLREKIGDVGKFLDDSKKFAKIQLMISEKSDKEGHTYSAAKAKKFAEDAEKGILPGIGFIEDLEEKKAKTYGRLIDHVTLEVWETAETIAQTSDIDFGGVYAMGKNMAPVNPDTPVKKFTIDVKTGIIRESETTIKEFFKNSSKKQMDDEIAHARVAMINVWATPDDHPADMPIRVIAKDKHGHAKRIEVFEGPGKLVIGMNGYPICSIFALYTEKEVEVRMKIQNGLRQESFIKANKREEDRKFEEPEEVWLERQNVLNGKKEAAYNGTDEDWAWGFEKAKELLNKAREISS
jgi:hypothetical protein